MLRLLPLATILTLSIFGCAEREIPTTQFATDQEAVDEPVPTPETELAYADGWETIVIRSGYTDTKVDTVGHFIIERNNCLTSGYGSMELDTWNQLAKSINSAMKMSLIQEETCIEFEPSWENRSLDGWVEVRTKDGGKRMLLEVQGSRGACTHLSDRDTAQQLLKAVNKLLPKAFAEDCTIGR